jgi:hypothetical protein
MSGQLSFHVSEVQWAIFLVQTVAYYGAVFGAL